VNYDFKKLEEAGWFVLVTVVTTIASALIDFDPDKIADWRAWAVGIAAGCVRAIAGIVIAALTKPG
jgi:hypothetical protein